MITRNTKKISGKGWCIAMDKRTRVYNALNKLPVDHVPVGFWYHFDGENAYGEPCVQAHLDYYRDVDLDMIKIMCDGYFPYPVAEGIEKAADWRKLKPLGPDHPFIQEQVWRAKRIVQEVGKECCVFYNVFAPFSSIRFGYPEDKVLAHLKEDKHAVMHALDVIAQDNATLAELLITEAGCDGVYYCVQGGEVDRFTAQEYREMIAPSDLYVLEHANRFSENNIMHCCGWAGAKNRLSVWQDYPVKCVNWAVFVEEMPLTEGRFFWGGRAVLGGFQSLHQDDGTYKGILHTGTEEEVKAYTRELIANYGKLGLLLGADCTVDARMSHDRLRWVVQAAREL